MSIRENFARPAVLLNPAAGEPTDADSHIGGPVLWPIDEPWPWCEGDGHYDINVKSEGVRLPFVGALQLYRRDFPELPFPEGTDLLQVFLCTVHHIGVGGPDVRLVWRDSSTVVELVEEEPEPSVQEEIYVPTVNVLEPIRFTEYAHPYDRPEELEDEEWPETSAGTKIGGWTCWWQTGPATFTCPECGAEQRQTLSLGTREPSGEHVEWAFGRDGNLNVLTCEKDVRHPFHVHVD
ncbi:hypothetical protein ACFWN2_09490 [Lentzea sp. NPDC058436]|uniref:hypothetical protein n=1 Tax=Lentzea sp. NPDC058436 TaxID=3346499 RepID=UPI003655633F